MTRLRTIVIAFLTFFNVIVSRKTLVISSDGFRWDYFGRFHTPGLDRLRSHGVHVKNLENAFATVTFPNHFTLVTGLYEESHGIVDNDMFDPVFNESFHMNTVDPKWWQGGEPIWVTANKSNIGSVCVNWVGCSVPIRDIRPTVWAPYNGTISFNERVDKIVEHLFSNDGSDVDLGLLYFEEPDHSCHMHGPDSPGVADAITLVDNAISRLLEKADLMNVNIIFTADHGGYGVSKDRLIVLDEYIQELQYFVSASGAVAHVWVNDSGTLERALRLLSGIPIEHGRCTKKEDIARGLHYSDNRRIAPIVCIAELGWSIVETFEQAREFPLRGSHGWDARNDPDSPMRPVFIAAGPDIIESTKTLEPFRNIHLFPLVHKLLGLDPKTLPAINGTIESIRHILRQPSDAELDPYVVVQW